MQKQNTKLLTSICIIAVSYTHLVAVIDLTEAGMPTAPVYPTFLISDPAERHIRSDGWESTVFYSTILPIIILFLISYSMLHEMQNSLTILYKVDLLLEIILILHNSQLSENLQKSQLPH